MRSLGLLLLAAVLAGCTGSSSTLAEAPALDEFQECVFRRDGWGARPCMEGTTRATVADDRPAGWICTGAYDEGGLHLSLHGDLTTGEYGLLFRVGGFRGGDGGLVSLLQPGGPTLFAWEGDRAAGFVRLPGLEDAYGFVLVLNRIRVELDAEGVGNATIRRIVSPEGSQGEFQPWGFETYHVQTERGPFYFAEGDVQRYGGTARLEGRDFRLEVDDQSFRLPMKLEESDDPIATLGDGDCPRPGTRPSDVGALYRAGVSFSSGPAHSSSLAATRPST